MYMAKNNINKIMIFRAIDRGATELAKSAQSTVPTEMLARTQSLLLYQMIRLFDGDVSSLWIPILSSYSPKFL
jgi:hypothetical protein